MSKSKGLDRQVPLQAAFNRAYKDIMIMMSIMQEESSGDAIPVYIQDKDFTIIFCKGDARNGILKYIDPKKKE